MQCPACSEVTLAMTHREGIEIDYCPKCRGVWLDRGELDKVIERSMSTAPTTDTRAPEARYSQSDYRKYDDDDKYRHGKRKRGMLGDLFDFD
jgi:Zn-finger nucleic acid-binding protein